MQRKLCNEGFELDRLYMQSVGEWINAESDKRTGTGPFSERADRAEKAKTRHSEAQWAFIDHVVACRECSGHAHKPI